MNIPTISTVNIPQPVWGGYQYTINKRYSPSSWYTQSEKTLDHVCTHRQLEGIVGKNIEK